MAERFEDLIAWQKARALTAEIYELTRSGQLSRDFGMSAQIQRSAVSIMANIAEGFERHRAAEFHQFLSVAKSSCAEVRSHLYVLLDAGYIEKSSFEELMTKANEVARILSALRTSVERQKNDKQ